MERILKEMFTKVESEKKVIISDKIYVKISNELLLIANLVPDWNNKLDDRIPYLTIHVKMVNTKTGVTMDENNIFISPDRKNLKIKEGDVELITIDGTALYWGILYRSDFVICDGKEDAKKAYENISNKINQYIEIFK